MNTQCIAITASIPSTSRVTRNVYLCHTGMRCACSPVSFSHGKVDSPLASNTINNTNANGNKANTELATWRISNLQFAPTRCSTAHSVTPPSARYSTTRKFTVRTDQLLNENILTVSYFVCCAAEAATGAFFCSTVRM